MNQSPHNKPMSKRNFHLTWTRRGHQLTRAVEHCTYCQSKTIAKRGRRQKKYEVVQLHLCKACQKTLTPQLLKGKHYSIKVILDAISLYNLGHTKPEACRLLKEKYGLAVKPSTLSNWLMELAPLCRYSRLRPRALKLYSSNQVIKSVTLNHRQVYHYSYHQAKLHLLLEQKGFKEKKFYPLKNWFQNIQKNCPHHYFQAGNRSSQATAKFNIEEVLAQQKQNYATRLAQLVLQAVVDNRLRHEVLQQSMLANDSVTLAYFNPHFSFQESTTTYSRTPLKLI